MRNLNIEDVHEIAFTPDDLPLTASTFDTSTGDVICSLGPTISRPVIELRRYAHGTRKSSNDGVITSWDAPCPLPGSECDLVLSLQYFADSSSICVVLAGGDIVLVREKPLFEQERIEIVGSIDAGLSAAQWSWNGSLLALVTRTGSLVLMSQQLEPVNETILRESDLQLSKHVSVGWGKKETQFQGKRAKAMRDPTMPESINEGRPSTCENGQTVVSWRGDGAYVAVNTVSASSRRVIRVYSSDGILDSVSEPVDGLESALAWRPYGNLIASVKRSVDKVEVVFFERNGLRHGQFDLRLSENDMLSFGADVSLSWNHDSTILAARLLDRVLLWTVDNYHYALKQDIRVSGLQAVTWHPADPLRINLFGHSFLQSMFLYTKVLRGSMCSPFDYGLVAVIDGKAFQITPLKHANVPPPLAYLEITADDNIIAAAISRTCQRVAFLTNSVIYLCKLEMRHVGRKAGEASIRHSSKFHVQKLSLPNIDRTYMQVFIQDDDKVYLLSPARSSSGPGKIENNSSVCDQFAWVSTTRDHSELQVSRTPLLPSTKQLILDVKQQEVFGKEDGFIYSLTDHSSRTRFQTPGVFEVSRYQTAGNDQMYAVSLSKSQKLTISYGDVPHEISNVTSYAVTEKYIIYTTSTHLLKFIHLDDRDTLAVPDDTPEIDERCRTVERGATIVTVIPSRFAVVLQMPRGNLETIYPRIMVLAGIRSQIRSRDYRKAFTACQTHQVDLNILYDYDPTLFFANFPLFIDELKKPSRVDEFLQKLKSEDVTVTLYHDTGVAHDRPLNVTEKLIGDEKVNEICNSMISELQRRPAAYQPNMVTAYVCKRPPDLISALTLVANLRKSSIEEADLAIAHLCFLTDNNRLYDTALSLYDLELTLLVAQNSQRDPREYMPFLQSLQALHALRRRYTIDNHLKKHSKALVSLHQMEEHEEVEAYTVKHHLFADAIGLYENSPTHRDRISRLYADYLSKISRHAQAAALYEALSDFSLAYPLYVLAHMWREALSCACLVPVSESQLQSLARSLATTCSEESRDYRSAATIQLEYLHDALGAAELLCKGSYFAEAMRILSHPEHSRQQSFNPSGQLIAIVDVALTRKVGEILELIADCQTQLKSQVPRIEELRIKKTEDPFAFFGGDATAGDGVDIPDNISLAPTDASTLGGQSMFTRYGGGGGGSSVSTKFGGTVRSDMSRKTSKTKRKEERKRAKGKKGSVYEEEYLVASCSRLIERVNGVHDEVRRLVYALGRRGFSKQAAKVDEVMQLMQVGCEDARRRVAQGAYDANLADGTTVLDGAALTHNNGQIQLPGVDGTRLGGQLELQDEPSSKVPDVKAWKTAIA